MTTAPALGTPVRAAYELYRPAQRRWLLAVLFLVSMSNYIDRNVIAVLLEPIKKEFAISDTLLGLLSGFAFAVFYATLGIPVARWADRGNRRVVVTLALTVWSVMTVACGMAQTFVQLVLARIGVGAGEAGALPPAQSLIADYFPPDRRASAIAIFISSATAGYLIAFIGGAMLVSHYGWRTAFVAVGTPGLLLAMLTFRTLKEPRDVIGYPVRNATSDESFAGAVKRLFAKRAYVWIVVGIALYAFMAYGALIFIPSFMIRSLGISMSQIGATYGSVSATGALLGTVGGGWLADKLGSRDARWLAWLPALACSIACPFYIAGFLSGTFGAFLAFSFVAGVLIAAGLPSVFTAMHAVCGSKRRAVAVAVLTFVMSTFGGGLGPLVTGILSDHFAASLGANALRAALVVATAVLLPSAFAMYVAGRSMLHDVEN